MSKELSKYLGASIAGFLAICAIIYVVNNGFALPEPLSKHDSEHAREVKWSFEGATGTFDRGSVQRGYKVYKEVCASCHSMKLVSYRTLQNVGFSEAEVKALAAEFTYSEIGDDGEPKDRAGVPNDKFKSPYANNQAAAASNNGAVPPDLSLMVKARENGPNYLYSLLTGYGDVHEYVCTAFNSAGGCAAYRLATEIDRKNFTEQDKIRTAAVEAAKKANQPEPKFSKDADKPDALYPCLPHGHEGAEPIAELKECKRLGAGMHYNPYFPGRQIAMPAPLHTDGQVELQDGTKATVDQMSRDVVNFLQWTAEPEMEQRKQMGLKAIIFLAIFTVFFYIAKVRIWARVE